jgi:hypothetical protein
VTSQCIVGYKFFSTDLTLDWLFDTVVLYHVIKQQRFFVSNQLATNVALEWLFRRNAMIFQVLLKTMFCFKGFFTFRTLEALPLFMDSLMMTIQIFFRIESLATNVALKFPFILMDSDVIV